MADIEGPGFFTYRVAPDGASVTVVRRDLPSVADEKHYEITFTVEDLNGFLLDMLRNQRTIRFNENRTGDL